MASDPTKTDLELDALFEAARDDAPRPQVTVRVLEDANRIQAQGRQAAEAGAQRPQGRTWIASALAAIGGWPGASGVTAAAVLGLGLGLYAPDLVDTLSGGQMWELTGTVSATPDIGGLWTELDDV